MQELLQLIHDAWEKRVQPLIQRDPVELERRLARRRAGMMRRPPRAWCLAIRASDQRINPGTAACVPEEAAYHDSQLGSGYYSREFACGRHETTITAPLLRKICRPFVIPKPGLDMEIVARELGVSRTTLKQMVGRGMFNVHYVQNLGGKWGHPVPVLYTDRPLDPCNGRGREYSDPAWGMLSRYVADHVPADLEQTLVRVPHWIERKHGRKRGPLDRLGTGQIDFMGWKWQCPACGKTRRVLYYPLPPLLGLRPLDARLPCERDPEHPDARAVPLRTFACAACHGVMFSMCNTSQLWNRLISHLSDGMMYGHEVPRPQWFKARRKVNWHAILNRAPSRRRHMILEDILAGLSYRQIMRKQGIAMSTVGMQALKLYKQHRVKGPDALRELLLGERPSRQAA